MTCPPARNVESRPLLLGDELAKAL